MKQVTTMRLLLAISNLQKPTPIRWTSAVLAFVFAGLCLASFTAQSLAQQFPTSGYYALMRENSVYHMGELRDAERGLRNVYSSAYREGNVRWIDSSAYLSLQGELRFQMGDYDGAITNFNDAILIYLNMAAWPTMVDWQNQQVTQLDNNALRSARITWGQPTRNTRIGRFPSSYLVQFGQDIIIQGEKGNVRVPNAKRRPVDIFELTRALALGIRRRDQILGPLSAYDETSRLLRTQLQEARMLVPASIPSGIGSILYGISVAGEGNYKKSNEILQANLQIDGFDHPLTPVTLLQIGYNQYMSGDYRAAKATLGEASFSAAIFEQYDVFRESLVLAAKAHTAVNRDQELAELGPASEWARLHGLRMAQAQFAMVVAENEIENGNIPAAVAALELSKNAMRTTSLAKTAQALRLTLLEKITSIISGKDDDILGLRNSLELYRNQTLWWYRVEYLRNPRKNDTLTTTTLSSLIKAIARDPVASDWEQDPIDTLAFLTGDRSGFVMDDLDLMVSKRNFNDALLTSELIRRMEFLYRLPLGGRLMSLRELIIREPAELTPDLMRRQAEVRSRFAGLQELMDSSKQLRTQLDQMPVQPPEDEQREWLEMVQNWGTRNLMMERGLVNLSVRREALPLMFPPAVDLERTQAAIPDKSICLVIKQSRGVYHVFLVTKDTIAYQSSLNSNNVSKAIRGLAKQWGHTNANAVLQTDVLEDNKWKALSNSTLMALVPKSTPEFWETFDELVVIPDGQFWYLPFETLTLESKPDSELLIDKLAIRYSPTLGLAFDAQVPRRLDRVAFYPGKIDLKDEDELAQAAAADFVTRWPKSTEITSSELTPDQMGPLVDSMVVWNEIRTAGWPIDNSRPKKHERFKALNLDAWPYLPNNGPEFFAFAGANTSFADGMRKKTDSGNEIGYYATLMMAAGVKSMVLPRWRTGGNMDYEFQLALAEEIQKPQPTATSVRNVMQKLRDQEIDLENQNRLRLKKQAEPLKASHPFLWANNMVIDRGQWYQNPEREPSDTPLLKAGGSDKADGDANDPDKAENKTDTEKPASDMPKEEGEGKPADGVASAMDNDGQKAEAGKSVAKPEGEPASGPSPKTDKPESGTTPPPSDPPKNPPLKLGGGYLWINLSSYDSETFRRFCKKSDGIEACLSLDFRLIRKRFSSPSGLLPIQLRF